MSFDVSALSAYVKENASNIVTRSLVGLRANKYVTVQPGIKSAENVNTIVTDAVIQAGACGWSPSGTTTLANRTITVKDLMIQEGLCQKTLDNTLFQLSAKAGALAGAEDLSIEELYADLKVKMAQDAVEAMFWTGVSSATSIQGVVPTASADAPAANKMVRTASVLDDIDSLLALLPAGVRASKGLYCYMSAGNFMSLMNEIRDKNWFHIATGSSTGELEFVFPGTNMKVVGLEGFGSDDSIMIANQSNIIMGTDLANDFEDADFWYSQDNREHRFHMNFRVGGQIAIPEEVVIAE